MNMPCPVLTFRSIDKRIVANAYENELAGDIVKDFITTVFCRRGDY